MDISYFVYLFISGELRLLLLSGFVSNVAINMGLQASVPVLTFSSFGNKPDMELHGSSIFNFLRNCHTVFLSNCTILHSTTRAQKFHISLLLC